MPSPILTITIESLGNDGDEHHVHPGGQGFWVARMVRSLGVDVCLASPFGADSGAVLRHLIEQVGVKICGADVQAANGSYIHDRRGGERQVVSQVKSARLSRHEVDDLYDAALTAALDSTVLILTGPDPEQVVPADTFTRLALDCKHNGIPVVADTSTSVLDEVLAGGIDVLKISDDELLECGFVDELTTERIVQAACDLHEAGAQNLVISSASGVSLALIDGEMWEVEGPKLHPLESRGAGDSMTAGITAGIARGYSLIDAVRLGAGAGTLNVTRHGLGSGKRDHIERITQHVALRRLGDIPNPGMSGVSGT